MTRDHPDGIWGPMAGKILISLVLLVIGGLANQFLNIPVQQAHQDDRLNALEKHMEYNDKRLDEYVKQHDAIEHQLEEINRQMHELEVMHQPPPRGRR